MIYEISFGNPVISALMINQEISIKICNCSRCTTKQQDFSLNLLMRNESEFIIYATESEKNEVPSSCWNWAIIPGIRLIVFSTYISFFSNFFCKAARIQPWSEVLFYAGENELKLGIKQKLNNMLVQKCEGFQCSDESRQHSVTFVKIPG